MAFKIARYVCKTTKSMVLLRASNVKVHRDKLSSFPISRPRSCKIKKELRRSPQANQETSDRR